MQTTRRLELPGGGSVDIMLDDVVAAAPLAGPGLAATRGPAPWGMIALSAALAGGVTYLIWRLSSR